MLHYFCPAQWLETLIIPTKTRELNRVHIGALVFLVGFKHAVRSPQRSCKGAVHPASSRWKAMCTPDLDPAVSIRSSIVAMTLNPLPIPEATGKTSNTDASEEQSGEKALPAL